MTLVARPESLRILCLDGGGIKGYTTLLILKRILRTMKSEGQLPEMPLPCEIFDLIVGTSTGGLIAVMLGRLHMTIDECIAKYEEFGREVFGIKIRGGVVGKALKGLRSSPLYDITVIQEQVKKALDSKNVTRDTAFLEPRPPLCKVVLCVTRSETSKADILRNYESHHPTAENYNCCIWEAASATAAAPIYFKGVQFNGSGEKWCDGGLRRNNPINEALAEISREREWDNKKLGCVLSLGTGVSKSSVISSNLGGVLRGAIAIMTDSDDIARVFASSELGIELARSNRYYRFSIPQGMQELELDEWKETEKMRALTTHYLSSVSIGDMLVRCAKSLLDPDENLQLEIKPKQSIIPYHPCIHFIERGVYTKTLLEFFKTNMPAAQIFVLWGLGGTGKTQIALKFAQSIKYRLSVFWIRADLFTNFAVDFGRILDQLDPTSAEDNRTVDPLLLLEKTRNRLEDIPGEWLLILDNADSLDAFLGRGQERGHSDGFAISSFIPRHGRILITTRDRRFQGTVASANNGMKVGSMNQDEAKDLLIGSIPKHLIRDTLGTMKHAEELIEELGYLPLAISQAAANIVDQHLTLEEYVSFYKDKKQRMGLMKTPARDFQTTDPRNASQSVHVTWHISFDVLKDTYPLSAMFLYYMGCFHWRNIPRVLLQRLPAFSDLDTADFIQLSKKPLNLSLIDEYDSEPGLVEYSIHPLVHENILGRLPAEEIQEYLKPAVDLLSGIFPSMFDRNQKDLSMAIYLIPHATRQVELCSDLEISSQSLVTLLFKMSLFFNLSNRFNLAASLAEESLSLGSKIYINNPVFLLTLRSNVVRRYTDAGRCDEAEQEARDALEWLDSDEAQAHINVVDIKKESVALLSDLAMALSTGTLGHAERERIHLRQLASGVVDEKSAQGANIRHNLAHALTKQGKFEEAAAINNALLDFAESPEGNRVVTKRLYLIILNLKALILRSQRHEPGARGGLVGYDPTNNTSRAETLQIYEIVFKVSMAELGIDDKDTWIAANNILGHLSQDMDWGAIEPILPQFLTAAIEAKVSMEGSSTATLMEITETAKAYMHYILISEGPNSAAVQEFATLYEKWLDSSGCGLHATNENIGMDALNNRAVHMQQKGLFEQAEMLHRRVIDLCRANGRSVESVYWYNIMLAIGRQGRLEEAKALRIQHEIEIGVEEAKYGTLEARLEADRAKLALYAEAQAMLDAGQLDMEGEWYLANKMALRRAEFWLGKLQARSHVENETVEKKEIENKRKGKRILLLPFRKRVR